MLSKQKDDPGKPQPIKELSQSMTSSFPNHIGTDDPEVELTIKVTPKLRKDWRAAWHGYARPSGIKRTRKRVIEKAKLMDHGGYEWSQHWRKQYGKFRRNTTRYSQRRAKND